MTLSTFSAAANITPVVFATFLKHWGRKIQKRNIRDADDTEAVDDILFDEAFHIVKAFLELATRNTVDELQAYTNTYVPPPFWIETVSCVVPLSCCNQAADTLISWFGEQELASVAGGERWWQVRGLDGLQAEWIAMKRDWEKLRRAEKAEINKRNGKGKGRNTEVYTERFDDLNKVLFYLPGGGFYFGSINTHRYQIIRMARKMGGRAFAVNYRKAPQYPWPCPLQDVLAAYLYLIRPPPGAPHKPIPSHRIVIAGDSAGGNLCLSLLIVLRDLGIPMPAGTVLISPWVDLTHSFNSVMTNTSTDIIPPFGFIHKPSTLWPMDTALQRATMYDAHEQGNSTSNSAPRTGDPKSDGVTETLKPQNKDSQNQGGDHPDQSSLPPHPTVIDSERDVTAIQEPPVKRGDPIEVGSQIQLYASNRQLSHPLVSPLLCGSLGGLPPMYVLAGDDEVLRDEIIYLTHRAAQPWKYPVRDELMQSSRQKESFEKYKTGTQVHFQLFDDMCHVLTVFSFTNSAAYAYRAIARFSKRVIESASTKVKEDGVDAPDRQLMLDPFPTTDLGRKVKIHESESSLSSQSNQSADVPAGVDEMQQPEGKKGDHVSRQKSTKKDTLESTASHADRARKTSTHSSNGSSRPPGTINILCERINIHGRVRPLEADEELDALKMPKEEIGLVKEGPVKRWLDGQKECDRKWGKAAEAQIMRHRQKCEEKYAKVLAGGTAVDVIDGGETKGVNKASDGIEEFVSEGWDTKRRWNPTDLEGENPPPSAIARRRDTPDAVTLLKTSFHRPTPHAQVPVRVVPSSAVSAKWDALVHRKEAEARPITQSASEQQRQSNKMPTSHGVRMWSSLMGTFMVANTKKEEKKEKAKEKLAGAE